MLAAMPAMAQLNNTVEVTNEVKPATTDVKKVEIKTQPIKTEVKHYTMPYAMQGETLTQYAEEPLADYHSTEKEKGNKNGYAHLGGGSHGIADGRFAYKFDMSDADALNIDLSLQGFNGQTGEDERQNDEKWKSRFYHSRAAMRYDHFLDNGLNMYVKGYFDNDAFNYRTRPYKNIAPNRATQKIFADFNPFFPTDKQRNMQGSAAIGIEPWTTNKLTISASGEWRAFRQDRATNFSKAMGQSQWTINANADYAFDNEQTAGIEMVGDQITYRNSELKNHTCATFTPYYRYRTDDMNLKLGLFVNTEGEVAPDLSLNYRISDSQEVYTEIKGYEVGNDLYYLAYVHPYFMVRTPDDFNGLMEIEDEFHQIDARLGYRLKNNIISANIYGGYDMSENHVDIIEMTGETGGIMMPLMEFKKNKRIYFGADLCYTYKDLVRVEGRNRLNIESFRQDCGWTEGSHISPAFSMDWRADFSLMKDLTLGIDWNFHCYSLPDLKDNQTERLDRKNTVNIGADLRYTLPASLPLTVFVKGDNLLFQKYDRYYGYQNIGANILGGVAISF